MKQNKRRKYDADFKRSAVALSEEPGRNAYDVERSLGIPKGTICKWKQNTIKQGKLAFPGNGKEALTPDQIKIRELEKKLKDSEIEKEILKKAVAIFSKTPK